MSTLFSIVLCSMMMLVALPNIIAAAALTEIKPAIVAEPTHVAVHEHTLAKVGDVVESVPTSVSHQSSTIVHSRGQRVTPIVAPAIRSYAAPAVRTYPASILKHTPLTPLLHTVPTAEYLNIAHPLSASPSLYAGYGYGYNYGTPLVYAASPV